MSTFMVVYTAQIPPILGCNIKKPCHVRYGRVLIIKHASKQLKNFWLKKLWLKSFSRFYFLTLLFNLTLQPLYANFNGLLVGVGVFYGAKQLQSFFILALVFH